MTSELALLIEEFRKWAGFQAWRIDPDGELTMLDKEEPFGCSEYKVGSEIHTRWRKLQNLIDRDL